MKKISEITVEKEVSRTRRDSYGNKYQEDLIFELKYNPTITDFLIRVFAKAIDFVFYIILIIFFFLVLFIFFASRYDVDNYTLYSLGLILLLLINPLFESKYGKSLGKKILKIQVINDYCEYPNLLKSYKRNFFSLINVFNLLRILPAKIGAIKNNKHNEICKTYTIRDKKKSEIIELMKK